MSCLRCPCCFGNDFEQFAILWPDLVAEWGLSPEEHRYIDEQQGLRCTRCTSPIRSMVLAQAILNRSRLPLRLWVRTRPTLRVLEINQAGTLTQFLHRLPRHVLTSYPDVDMMALPFADREFDLIVHSDTLEHVPDPVQALRECRRVLKSKGRVCYTIPIIVDRLTASRAGRAPSYHGLESHEFLVHTEFGADAWKVPIEAGFGEVRLTTLRYPAGIAIEARGPSHVSHIVRFLDRIMGPRNSSELDE